MLKIIKQTSFIVFAAAFIIVFIPGYAKIQELRQKNRDLEIKIKKLRVENVTLKQEKDRLQDDPEYLEEVARERLGIVKKGETVLKMVPQEQKKK